MKSNWIGALLVCFIFLMFSTNQVFAGPGHDGHTHSHDIDANQAQQKGKKVVAKLIARKKINDSWSSATPATATQKQFGNKKEWIVTFKNPKESDKTKQTLYIFLSHEGKYIAANFTGK